MADLCACTIRYGRVGKRKLVEQMTALSISPDCTYSMRLNGMTDCFQGTK